MSKEEKRVSRSFSEEFKKDAIGLVLNEGYSNKQAADAVGVSDSSIRDWIKKFSPPSTECGDNATKEQLLDENRRLKKELRESELEKAILKKAAAYFAKESL